MSVSSCESREKIIKKPSNKINKSSIMSTNSPLKAPKAIKNWDKIVNDIEEEEKKEDEGVEDMFQKLYAQGDDDTKRAMKKSFYESNGTTLSMDWKEVGSKFVKPYKDNKEELENGSDSDQ